MVIVDNTMISTHVEVAQHDVLDVVEAHAELATNYTEDSSDCNIKVIDINSFPIFTNELKLLALLRQDIVIMI